MSEELYTKEPWSIANDYGLLMTEIVGKDGTRAVGVVWTKEHVRNKDLDKIVIQDFPEGIANARRIVACVNACKNLPIEQLELAAQINVDPVVFGETIIKQRDALIKAMELLLAQVHLEPLAKSVIKEALSATRD